MVTRLQTNKRWSRQKHGQILKTQSSSPQITKDHQSPISTIATFTNLVRNPSEYSDCSAGNGNNAHLRFSVTNHSINSYDTIQSTRSISLQNSNTNMFKRRPWLKLAIVIIVVLVLAGISAAVTVLVLRNKPGDTYITPGDTYITPVQMMVRVDDNYTAEMNNTSSEVFQKFNDSFCSNLTNTLLMISKGVSCQVNSLRNGSIIVNSTVYTITDVQPTEDSIMGILQSASPWKNVSVNTSNINMSIGQSELLGHVFPARMDTFDCLNESDGTLLPLKNTYPDNCSSFQICDNGVGTRVSCEDLNHFAINKSSVCISQTSLSTYCNKRRLNDSIATKPSEENLATSSTSRPMTEITDTTTLLSTSSTKITTLKETPSTITSVSSLSTTYSTTRPTEVSSLSTTYSTTHTTEVSSLSTTYSTTHPTEVSSLSTTYNTTHPSEVNCTGLNGNYFPSHDTYPNKCNQFIRCVNGLPVPGNCSACTYFTEETHVCDWYYANNTYCAIKASKMGNNSSNLFPKCNNTAPGINNCSMSFR